MPSSKQIRITKAASCKRESWQDLLVRENGSLYGNGQTTKTYDLEERTFLFAQAVRTFVKLLPKTVANIEDIRQLVRASGSVGANYIEANEALGKKDFLMRIKISRKEAKESRFFLRLVDTGDQASLESRRNALIQEAMELTKIFSAILLKSN